MAQLLKNVPPVLYKFRGGSTETNKETFERDVKTLLVDRQLYLPSPLALNDPFDCYPAIVPPPIEVRALLVEEEVASAPCEQRVETRRRCELLLSSPAHRERYQKEFYDKDLGSIGVATLSSAKTHPLMWAHYGGNSTGFVVGYRAEDSEQAEAIPAMPVSYVKQRPQMWPFGGEDWKRILFTKSEHWSYEKEWRYVRVEEEGGYGPMSVPPSSILEVCLGPKMDSEDKATVIQAAKALSDRPTITQARLHSQHFGLEFHEVPDLLRY